MVKMGKDMQRSKDLSEGCIPEIHVLAVDDSNIDRKVIERLLKNFSYKVTAVDSAERALEILGIVEGCSSLSANAYQINLIITDYCMPDMTGFDLLKKVKETSSLKEIPVVIMSSENVPQRIKRCMAEGAEEFIMKPVQVSDIKRLRGHVRRNTSTSEELIPTPNCPKRKLADGLGKAKPGRSRPIRSLTVS